MGSTFLSLNYHIVFSTKERHPWIDSAWRPRLHQYLGGTIRGLDGVPLAVGGVEDHVHLLVGLKATHTLADFVREVKKAATAWVREERLESAFQWQEGYAAFTISPKGCEGVKGYIRHQEEHHHGKKYIDELKWLLDEAGIKYEERYLE